MNTTHTHTQIKQLSPPWPVILAPRCRPVPRQGRYIDRGRWSICYLFIRIEIFLPTCVVVMFDHVIKHWINCLVHHSLENKFSVSKIHHGEEEVCVQSFSGLHLFLSSAVTEPETAAGWLHHNCVNLMWLDCNRCSLICKRRILKL